jgi:hypothetical protein
VRQLSLLVLSLLVFSTFLSAEDRIRLRATLSPLEENPTNITSGYGKFRAVINGDQSITFRLSYNNMSTPVTQAHIHIGATKINGAIAIFFCGPSDSPAHQTCPNDSTNSGTVTGTVTAADVVINAQGVSPGEFGKVLRAIVEQVTYANVHTMLLPGGEIRGQVKARHEDKFRNGDKSWDDDDDD